MNNILTQQFINELKSEAKASRACLEGFKEELYDWKPHEKSMQMGYLALMIAEIPLWLKVTIEEGVIDLATWKRFEEKTPEAFVKHFDECMDAAVNTMENTSDEALEEMFYLKMNGEELMKDTKRNMISSSINHWVHHRGQLTVYMRLNNIAVPSIYGPSADTKGF